MDTFIKYLNQFANIDKQTSDKLLGFLRIEKLQKDDCFLRAGSYCNKVGFIKSGVFRVFFLDDDGDEITRYFLAENQFVVDLSAFNSKTYASVTIQALTPCEIVVLDRQLLEMIPSFFIGWSELFHKLTENALLEKMQNRSVLVHQDAKTKYLNFVVQNPHLINRIPLGYLASYLGIKQQSLSRIRKEISKG